MHRHRVADLAGGDQVAQLHQRREEEVVLEDAQRRARRVARREHALGALEVARQRLLHLHVAAGLEHLLDDLGVRGRRHEHVDDVGVER